MKKMNPKNLPPQSRLSAQLVSRLSGVTVASQKMPISDDGAVPDRMTNHLLLKTNSVPDSSAILIDYEKFWGQFGGGWKFLVLQMLAEISDRFAQQGVSVAGANFELQDCKEKFGRLSVAYQSSIDVSDIVDDFETRSEQVCDVCSSGKGRLVRLVTGWQGTRCDTHEKHFP